MRWQGLVVALLLLNGCAGHPTANQVPAADWLPPVSAPQFAAETGPRVLVDAAHGNFHTIDGRFAAFARLLRADGYRVSSAPQPITPALLAGTDVFVIANAVKGGEKAEWVLPTPSAFEQEEVAALAQWVHDGGSLLLIADHMPFPGSAAQLAEAFGIVFLNGYAMKSPSEGGTLIYTRAGGLVDHAITRGRNPGEEVSALKAFTGQAFRPLVAVAPLMRMPPDWSVYFPQQASEFTATTPYESARGLLQGAVLLHGQGRVAVFGEAAMFSAQTIVLGDQVIGRMGMNDPEAQQNAQFVLNVLHWLSGLLPD
ncbi:MAG TPA: DUF4350 domain-containing protein [Steroidobacteraceae bacterium]|nr:DUF4350 domain-containing protein [Steroidobacteraceae bacterium]